MEDFEVMWAWGFPVGTPSGFSVDMGWVWGLKSNTHGNPDY